MKKRLMVAFVMYPLVWAGLGATGAVTDAYATEFSVETNQSTKMVLADLVPRDLEPLSLEEPVEVWQSMAVPSGDHSFKAQESWKALQKCNSVQYQMQQKAWTDENGFRRFGEEGYYMVAVGSYYASGCGEVLRFTLDSGRQFVAIVGDLKADVDTDAGNQYCMHNGSLVEFIVDLNCISAEARRRGDMSFSAGMQGKIVKVERMIASA